MKPLPVFSDSEKLSRSRETSIFTDKTAVAGSDGFSNGKPTKSNGFVDRMPSNGLMSGLADFRENGGRRRSSRNKQNMLFRFYYNFITFSLLDRAGFFAKIKSA